MRKLSVPYTIKRNGIYYLNLRWNNQFIRQSLATKDSMEAFQKVNQLAPLFSNPQTCEQTLRQQVSEMVGSGTRLKDNILKLVQPDESSLLLSQGFSLDKREQLLENWGVRTAAQNEASFKQLIKVIGDMPITAVTKSVVRDYKQILLSYPANRYKGKRIDKTLEQLERYLDHADRLFIVTINDKAKVKKLENGSVEIIKLAAFLERSLEIVGVEIPPEEINGLSQVLKDAVDLTVPPKV